MKSPLVKYQNTYPKKGHEESSTYRGIFYSNKYQLQQSALFLDMWSKLKLLINNQQALNQQK